MYRIAIRLGVLLVLTAVFLGSPAWAKAQKKKNHCSLDLYGDSILHGAYVHKEGDREQAGRWTRFPAAEIKTQRPAYTIHDRTLSGQSLAAMTADFKVSDMSRIVVLGNGIAEGWYGGDVRNTLANLVQVIRKSGGTPIITGYARQLPNRYMTPKKLAGRDRADNDAREVAELMRVAFVDFGAAGPIEIVDNVHPSEAYSLRLTERLIKTLDELAPECNVSG